MEPEYGNEIKDGTYVKTTIGDGVFYVLVLIDRKMELFLKEINPKLMAICILNGKIRI